jgi:HEAT repeat protein
MDFRVPAHGTWLANAGLMLPLLSVLCIGLLLPPTPSRSGPQSAPGEIVGHKIPVPGVRVEGTTAKLSEVEAEMVERLPPQQQAEKLLQYAISHHVGATDEIKRRVEGWLGKVRRTPSFDTLVEVAINGDDLRVRAAAWEVELAALGMAKTTAQVEALLREIQPNPSDAGLQIWTLGLLANRGVETERIHNELRVLMHAPDEGVRLRAVEAIGIIGTDATVEDLIEAFHHDPSFNVRIQGGGCGLAHCGMLTRAQRMQAVPGLIDMVEDPKVDPATLPYGYRALREITDETLPDDPRQWRNWYATHGLEATERFRKLPAGGV